MIGVNIFKNSYSLLSILAVLTCVIAAQSASAELYNRRNISETEQPKERAPATNSYVPTNVMVLGHMKDMRKLCLGAWEQEACLKELSYLAMDIATGYAEGLHSAGQEDSMENLKQHCAASTAAIKISVPAYAMRSAITECVNIISDIHDQTEIKPNLEMFSLLLGSVWCLGDDPLCSVIETKLLER